MFGKKNASSPKAKPKKSVKQGPQVNFFAAHAEKLVLGLVVGAVGFLVYEGIGGKAYDQARQPKQLEDQANQVSRNIKEGDPWPSIQPTVPAADHNYTPKTIAARQPTEDSIYRSLPMGGAAAQPFVKRTDPKLLAPISVLGQSVIGLLAVEADESYVDPFEDFDDAVKLKGKNSGSSSQNRNNRRSGSQGGYCAQGGAAGGGNEMGGSMGGYGGGTAGHKRLFPQRYNHGYSLGGGGAAGGMAGYGAMGGGGMGGMAGYGSEGGSGGGEMGMGGMPGGMGGGMAGGMGMGGGAGGVGGGGLNGGARPKPKKYKAESVVFNAVTALVPHEDMRKEYEPLRDSQSYNPMRDQPNYMSFEVEFTEVLPNGAENWQPCTNANEQLKLMKKWMPPKPQTIPEVIDLSSYDKALTMPIPPLLMQDYRKFAKHPEIDWIWDAGMNQTQVMPPMGGDDKQDNSDQFLPGERPGGAVGGMGGGMGGSMGGYGGGMAGGMGMGGGEGGMPGGMGGMPGGMGGMPGGMGGGEMGGAMGGSMGGYGGGMAGGMGMGGGEGGMPGGMGGMPGGMGGYGGGMPGGMGGYGGGMGAGMMMPAKYKMVRFYHMLSSKQIGKTFKYRVRLIMDDPNYPSDNFAPPPLTDLDPKVFTRVAQLHGIEDPKIEKVKQDNIKELRNAQAKRVAPRLGHYTRQKLKTEWSAASNGVFVRGNDDVYIHKMTKKSANPDVEAVVVKLDWDKGAYVPLFMFVEDKEALDKQQEEKGEDAKPLPQSNQKNPVFRRGAVLSMPAFTAQFAHPLTNIIKRWVGYSGFNTPWHASDTVVDVRGGDTLAGNTKDDPLTDNVEMMMLMNDGRVHITNEFDDTFQFRGFTLADEREAAEKGTDGAGGSMGGYGGGVGGMGGGGEMGGPSSGGGGRGGKGAMGGK